MESPFPMNSVSPLHLSDTLLQGSANGLSGDDEGLLPNAPHPLLK
jgi:hypothetical protein